MQKCISICFLLFFSANLFAQNEDVSLKRVPIDGLFLIDLFAPVAEVREMHVGYEIPLNRNKRTSVMFEGFVGLGKQNLVDEVNLLENNQRFTKLNPAKKNFGLGFHWRKYGFEAPYSWYVGIFSSFKRYHYKVTEGHCSGETDVDCTVGVRSLTVKSEHFQAGADFGFNKKLSELLFLNVSTHFGTQRVNNERSIKYDFQIFDDGFRNRIPARDLLNDPGGEPDIRRRGLFKVHVSLAFAIR